MKILNKYNTVIKYSIDLQYFNMFQKLSKTYYHSSKWRREEDNSFILLHDTFFKAKSLAENVVIDYHGQLELHCIFENVLQDAIEVLEIKDWAYSATKKFILENTKSFFYFLEFPEISPLVEEYGIKSTKYYELFVKNEIESIKQIMDSVSFEEMTMEEKEIAKMSHIVHIEERRSSEQ